MSNADDIKSQAEDLFIQANKVWDDGNARAAFKIFLRAASYGHVSASNSVGYFLDHGLGTRRNKAAAEVWYRKAARRGDLSAYSNIATNYLDAGNVRRARFWFAKAANRGDGGAAVELAKSLLLGKGKSGHKKALRLLQRAAKSRFTSDESRSEAVQLLARYS
jgi:hypothetical protein